MYVMKSVIVSCVLTLFSIQGCPTIITRSEWGARAPKARENLTEIPPPFVIIHHSDTPPCTTKQNCTNRIRSIQNFHMDTRKWSDIGYNFLIGEDGLVYEGRGWGIYGAHAPGFNFRSIGVCMIGTFQSLLPNQQATDALKSLIECGLQTNQIAQNYTLIGHRQARSTTCPGNSLYNEIKTWPHWRPLTKKQMLEKR